MAHAILYTVQMYCLSYSSTVASVAKLAKVWETVEPSGDARIVGLSLYLPGGTIVRYRLG